MCVGGGMPSGALLLYETPKYPTRTSLVYLLMNLQREKTILTPMRRGVARNVGLRI